MKPKPFYIVISPLGIVWGGSFVEVGLLSKWIGGLDPICYHRSLGIFIVGMILLGVRIIGTKKLLSGEKKEKNVSLSKLR